MGAGEGRGDIIVTVMQLATDNDLLAEWVHSYFIEHFEMDVF